MLQMVIGSIGHSIVIAKNGIEAIQILEKEKIDVILSDVSMPSMDGIELHKQVRAKPDHKETPFIFLTGLTDLNEVKKECTTSKDLLLQKPVSVDRLLKLFSGQLTKQL
ncbi:MAG: chemotaxis protein CheY [Bacteroidetes bacterium]|nr:chemotaxis protein CheY [Bacteroidota bacterium]